jgi:hypothetical protein
VLCAYYVRLARLVQVIVRDYVKAWCCTLARRRRIWWSVCRYPIFYEVELGCYVHVRSLTKDNKEEKSWLTQPQGGGEPGTCCVAMRCVMH